MGNDEGMTPSGEVDRVLGMNRRDFIRRSAVVGGTAMWVAPTIQSFASPAFGQSNSPITGFSYIAAVVECTELDGTTHLYRVKYELDEGKWECDPGNLPGCEGKVPSGWESAQPVAPANQEGCPNTGPFTITMTQSGSLITICVSATTVGLSCDFSFNGGVHGVIKEAQNCATGTLSNGDTCLTFDESQTDPN